MGKNEIAIYGSNLFPAAKGILSVASQVRDVRVSTAEVKGDNGVNCVVDSKVKQKKKHLSKGRNWDRWFCCCLN